MKKMIIFLVCFFSSTLFSENQFHYSPEFPKIGDTLIINIPDLPENLHIVYYFEKPFLYQDGSYLADNQTKVRINDKIVFIVPDTVSLLGFYFIDEKGNKIDDNGFDFFIPIYDSDNRPKENYYLNRAFILLESNPNYYKIEDFLKKEILLYPSNYTAHYFLWNYNDFFQRYPEKIIEVLNDWPYPVNDSGEWNYFQFSVNNRLERYKTAYEHLLASYRQTQNQEKKNRILSQISLYTDSLWLNDSLLNQLSHGEQSISSAQAYENYLYFLSIKDPDEWNRLILNGLESSSNAIREKSVYHWMYESLKENNIPYEKIKNELDNIFPPYYLDITELNRISSVISYFENFQELFLKYSEFVYEKLRNSFQPESNILSFNIIENYAYSLYLTGRYEKAFFISKELNDYSKTSFDDITHFRLGLIYYQTGHYDKAIEFMGKSYLENIRTETYEIFKVMYEEKNQLGDMAVYLDQLKKDSYTLLPIEQLGIISDYYPNQNSFILLYHPDSPLPDNLFEQIKKIKNDSQNKNLFVFFPENHGFNKEWETFFLDYGLNPIVIDDEMRSLFTSRFEESRILLIDKDFFLINRLNPYRPDWFEISKDFLKK